jgi:uncharacterized NAD(P)/FAD-binding protein YdhS
VRHQVVSATFCVTLADDSETQATRGVLALGHFEPKSPSTSTSTQLHRNLAINNSWDTSRLDQVPRDQQTLIFGTELTAIDALFKLNSAEQRNVVFMSRNGLVLHPHRSTPKPISKNIFPKFLDKGKLAVRYTVKALRENIRSRTSDDEDWRYSINELR